MVTVLVRLYCRQCKMGSDIKAWALTENDAKMLKDHAIKPE